MFFKILLKLCCLKRGREEALLLFSEITSITSAATIAGNLDPERALCPLNHLNYFPWQTAVICVVLHNWLRKVLAVEYCSWFVHTKGILHQEVMQSKQFSLCESVIILY